MNLENEIIWGRRRVGRTGCREDGCFCQCLPWPLMCHQMRWQMLEQPAEHQRSGSCGGRLARARSHKETQVGSDSHWKDTNQPRGSSSFRKELLLMLHAALPPAPTLPFSFSFFAQRAHAITTETLHAGEQSHELLLLSCATTATMGCICAWLPSSGMQAHADVTLSTLLPHRLSPNHFSHVCDNLLMQPRGNLCELRAAAQLLPQYYLHTCCFCARGLCASFLVKE